MKDEDENEYVLRMAKRIGLLAAQEFGDNVRLIKKVNGSNMGSYFYV